MMFGKRRFRLQGDFGNADAVFDEENILSAAFEDVHAAFFVPLGRRRFVRLLILHEFDGDVAEWLAGKILGDMCESAGQEMGVAVV